MVGTHLLPPNLLKLFAPRPAPPYLPPPGTNKEVPLRSKSKASKRVALQELGVAETLKRVRAEKAKAEQNDIEQGTAKEEGETDNVALCEEEKRRIRREEKKKRMKESWDAQTKNYNPQDDEQVVGDPYKTLFIARVPKDVSESELRRHFDVYGPIERMRLVTDKGGKSKGYCFIVYEREKDMKAAYKDADGLRLKNKRLLIDVERGRTVKNWKPRRLGGGLGGRPKPVQPMPAFGAPRGGFRGGRGGGFGPPRGGFGGRGGGPPMRGGYGGGPPPPQFNGGGPPMRGGYGQPPMRGGYGQPPMRGGYGGGGPPPPMRYDGPPGYGPPGGGYAPVDSGYGGQKRPYDGPPSGSDGYDSKRPRY